MRGLGRSGRLVGCLIGIITLVSGQAIAQQRETATDAVIKARMGVTAYEIQSLAPSAGPGQAMSVGVTLGGQAVVLDLEPASYRTADFRLLVDTGGGNIVEVPAPAPQTVRGFVRGVDAEAAGAYASDGLTLTIVGLGGEVWGIQPLSTVVPGAPADLHVVHRLSDLVDAGWSCGTENHNHGEVGGNAGVGAGSGGPDVLRLCEVAYDADFEFYQLNGSSVTNTMNDIENVHAQVNIIYERDVEVRKEITTIVVRSNAADPYTTAVAGDLLGQFAFEWQVNQGAIQRDVAHLMTGRDVNGSTIGIAYLSGICSFGQGYGLSQSRFTGSFSARVALTAHEMGHNWSAQHCDGTNPCRIMCSGLGGCNGISPLSFAPVSINQIVAFKNTRICLSNPVPSIALPLQEPFANLFLDPARWSPDSVGVVVTGSASAPSAPFVANLDTSSDQLVSLPLLATGVNPVTVRFSLSTSGVEAGEQLLVDYTNAIGTWFNGGTVTADGSNSPGFTGYRFDLPAVASNQAMQVRFRTTSTEENDDWFIDDIYVGAFNGNPLPFVDEFPTTTLSTANWSATTPGLTGVSAAAISPPSAPFAARIQQFGGLTSQPLLAGGFSTGTPLYLSFYTQQQNTEPGDLLAVSYTDDQGLSQELGVVSGVGTQTTFQFHEFVLPAAAYHDGMKFTLLGVGFESDDVWFIDNVSVDDESMMPPSCPADLTTGAVAGQPGYGVPNGVLNNDDFFYYLGQFASGNVAVADLTTGAVAGQPGYGVPNGIITNDDFFYYLGLFAAGC
ncbi:MAG: GC-type dockerin domain-anchored protein [Phycisphaerales bacterium]